MRKYAFAALVLLLPATSFAVDCTFGNIPGRENMKAAGSDVNDCRNHGGDPPKDWLPEQGKGVAYVPGTSFSSSVVQAPSLPPGAVNAPSSISAAADQQSSSFPPWAGFPCQLPGGINVCGGGDHSGSGSSSGGGTGTGSGGGEGGTGAGAGDTASNCPLETDTTGVFGAQEPLTTAASVLLPCGGAMPLTNYQLTLNKQPSALFATEQNAYNFWSYKMQGSGADLMYRTTSATGARLPTYLCMPHGVDNHMEKSVDLEPALAQFIVFNSSIHVIAVRLRPHLLTPMEMANPPPPQPEKYLIVPVVDGVPQMPPDCAKETDYYKEIAAAPGDIVIESSAVPTCETYPEQCAAVGINPNPTTNDSCDTVTIYPSGSTGNVSCDGATQLAVINRPNMIQPPGATPITIPIEGRTGHMLSADKDAEIFMPFDTIVRIGPTAPDIIFPEGGVLGLSSTTRLVMNGPATVRAASHSVAMTHGGQILDMEGNQMQSFGDNASYGLSVTPPYLLQAKRNFILPKSWQIPTQPNPYVRLPVPAAP